MIYNNITLAQKVSKNNILETIKKLQNLNNFEYQGVIYKRNQISGEWVQI